MLYNFCWVLDDRLFFWFTGTASQQWTLSPGVTPGSAKVTNVKGAGTGAGCWEIEACSTSEGAAVSIPGRRGDGETRRRRDGETERWGDG